MRTVEFAAFISTGFLGSLGPLGPRPARLSIGHPARASFRCLARFVGSPFFAETLIASIG